MYSIIRLTAAFQRIYLSIGAVCFWKCGWQVLDEFIGHDLKKLLAQLILCCVLLMVWTIYLEEREEKLFSPLQQALRCTNVCICLIFAKTVWNIQDIIINVNGDMHKSFIWGYWLSLGGIGALYCCKKNTAGEKESIEDTSESEPFIN